MIASVLSPSSSALASSRARLPCQTSSSARLRSRVLRVTAAKESGQGDDGKAFMESSVGKFVSQLTEAVTNSPINQGKIWLAKTQVSGGERPTSPSCWPWLRSRGCWMDRGVIRGLTSPSSLCPGRRLR